MIPKAKEIRAVGLHIFNIKLWVCALGICAATIGIAFIAASFGVPASRTGLIIIAAYYGSIYAYLWKSRKSASSSGESLPERAEVIVRRWRNTIYVVAFTLPLIDFGGQAILGLLGYALIRNQVLKDGMPSWILGHVLEYLVFVFFFDWPFFVLARAVERRLRARWPDVVNIYWSSAGALVGLSVPYILAYSLMLSASMMSGARQAGQGEGIVLGLAQIGGGALALAGWFTALGARHLWRFHLSTKLGSPMD
jgi:hypothetical protein